MSIAAYAREHSLPWSTAKKRLSGALPRAQWISLGRPIRRPTAIPDEKLARIRELLAAGEKHEWSALEVGVSRSSVTHIARGSRRKGS